MDPRRSGCRAASQRCRGRDPGADAEHRREQFREQRGVGHPARLRRHGGGKPFLDAHGGLAARLERCDERAYRLRVQVLGFVEATLCAQDAHASTQTRDFAPGKIWIRKVGLGRKWQHGLDRVWPGLFTGNFSRCAKVRAVPPSQRSDAIVTTPLKTIAPKGGAACPQAAADGSAERQPLGDKRLHPYCIVPD